MNDAVHKFAPLTDAERVAVPVVGEEHEDGKHVSPIPADAPDVPKTHPRFGRPTASSVYRDEQGATLFHVLRFDPPGERKQFLTLSLWRDTAGLRWRWKAFPTPRPLYNLDKLAARSDAPVVICEGEKSADAAARVFPNCVCITSPGGSQAASKADWSPLKGRRVLVWPDADEPGAKYAATVAGNLHGQASEVLMIDAMALASTAPGGGKHEPEKGWDAADAIAEWENPSALRKAAYGLATPFEPGAPGQPLVDMAAKLDAALLGITHFTKGSEGRSPIDRVTGSVAFGALARVVMVAAKQQDGDDGKSAPRVLMRAKSNIGPDKGGFAYSLELVPMFERPDIVASVVSWGESVDGNAREILAEAEEVPDKEAAGALQEATDFLLDLLTDGPKSAKEVRAAARDAGHSPRTIDRAKSKLGIASVKDMLAGGWMWSRPEERQERQGLASFEDLQVRQESLPQKRGVLGVLRGESEAVNDKWKDRF